MAVFCTSISAQRALKKADLLSNDIDRLFSRQRLGDRSAGFNRRQLSDRDGEFETALPLHHSQQKGRPKSRPLWLFVLRRDHLVL
jgi:hypothetical protein